jgi:hypothetical protein
LNSLIILFAGILGLAVNGYTHLLGMDSREASFFTTDKLNNIYLVRNNALFKYNRSGTLINNYNEKRFGRLSYVDVNNPLKILLLFSDFSQVIILDNKLALKSTVLLRDLNILQCSAICNSYNDAMWVFDMQDQRLKRIDQNRITNESGILGQLLPGLPLNPNFMQEDSNWLYVNNGGKGILVFDIYGTYYKTIPVNTPRTFQVLADQLVYLARDSAGTALKSYNLKSFEEKNILLPEPEQKDSIIDVRLNQQMLFVFKKESLDLYAF